MQSKNPVFSKSLWKTPNLYMTIPGIYLLLVAAVGVWLIYWESSPFHYSKFYFYYALMYIVPSISVSILLLSIKKMGRIISLILLFFWQIIASYYFFSELSMMITYNAGRSSWTSYFPLEWLSYTLIFTIANSIMFILLTKARKIFPAQETVR